MKLGEIVEKPISGEWGDEDLDGVGVPVLRTTNFTNEGVLNLNSVVTRLIPLEKCEKKYLCPGDIIIEKSGGSDKQPVGRVVFYDGPERQFLFNNFTAALRVKENLDFDKKFLFYALFVAYRRGGTEPYQNKTTGIRNLQLQRYLNELEVPAPPLAEQERIVAELDAVVATLKKRQAQLAELDALIEARFIELFGGERFPTVAIGDEFKTTSGGTPSSKTREYYDGGAIPWLNSGEVNRGVVDYAENFITELGLQNSSAKWVPVDSVLVAMYGATVGKVGLLRIPATTNQAVCSILPNPQFCPRYLYFAVKSQERWMRSQALGGAQPNISQTVIKKMTIPKPPLELQERFAAEVERVEALKTTMRAGIAETQTLFDALTQRYFG